MARSARIAVDQTVLIDLADGNRAVLTNLKAFRKAISGNLAVSQVTTQALASAVIGGSYDGEVRGLAATALQNLEKLWGIRLHRLRGAELGVCEQNVLMFINRKLVAPHSKHIAHTIAEAAALNSGYLLTHDPELLELDFTLLRKLLEECGREPLWIGTPANALKRQEGN